MVLASFAGSLALYGCKPDGTPLEAEEVAAAGDMPKWRTPDENAAIAEMNDEQFFNEHETSTLTVLCDLILPASGDYKSASDAEVVPFIEFMSKDIPEMQGPLRGGLMWIDHASNEKFNKEFKNASEEQQKEILDEIAYYDPNTPQNERAFEVNWFSLVRNLTMTGFYTSKIGIEEIGYKGNQPNTWDGVPQDVLDQHGVAYDEEWIAKCVNHSTAGIQAEWDDDGNLIT
tara:strand:- start:40902 stop:41591 length:690 start_codon:yes stop_codon:yes gene_type:complete